MNAMIFRKNVQEGEKINVLTRQQAFQVRKNAT